MMKGNREVGSQREIAGVNLHIFSTRSKTTLSAMQVYRTVRPLNFEMIGGREL